MTLIRYLIPPALNWSSIRERSGLGVSPVTMATLCPASIMDSRTFSPWAMSTVNTSTDFRPMVLAVMSAVAAAITEGALAASDSSAATYSPARTDTPDRSALAPRSDPRNTSRDRNPPAINGWMRVSWQM